MEKKNLLLAGILLILLAVVAYLMLAQAPATVPEPSSTDPLPSGYSLVFTELCTKNETVICDNFGKHPDYVELYNAGDTADLTGCYFTDGKTKGPAIENILLRSGEYRHFFLSDTITGFALSASGGDCIQLVSPDGTILAQTNTTALAEDQVMLWMGNTYITSYDASPGFSNDDIGLRAFREGSPLQQPAIQISEVLVQNSSALPDGNLLYPDFLELHNPTDMPISLDGWYLSDSLAERYTYRFPNITLEAGAYLLVCCDGGFFTEDSGLLHVNFGLSRGETLVLTDRQGGYSAVEMTYPGKNVSLALVEGEYIASSPSLGYANDESGVLAFQESRMSRDGALIISEVLLSSSDVPYEGTFQDVVEITNRSDSPVSTKGWYLSDGGDPFTYALPEIILQPGEVLVLPCSLKSTGFGLSDGEYLRLTMPNHRHLPEVLCVGEKGMSLSVQDYEELSYTFAETTLGYANTQENAIAYRAQQLGTGLRISEVISANRSYLKGYYSKTCDWVELYNASDAPINLGEYCITNNPNNLYKFPLPEKALQPGEYLVLFLTNDSTNLPRGYDILPFTISSQGEELLLGKNGLVVDYACIPALDVDVSYGRPAGGTDFDLLAKVTPGKENSEATGICAAPIAVTAQGSYDGIEYLDIVLEGDGEIYYTTNCTAPTPSSKRYTGPIRITQTTVIRAYCREAGRKPSKIVDLTYLINEDDALEAVCIVTHPDNLYDWETGIYVEGPNASDTFPYFGANFHMDWEKEASVSLFETDGSVGFSEPCGIKIFGAFSRANVKKSLACFFRSRYGCDTLNYPLYGEEGLDSYEVFVLRACGQDIYNAYIRDEVATSIAGEYTDLAVQDYRPVVVYLNGAYYGIHFIREKLNEHYVAGHYSVDPSSVTICERNGTSSQDYLDLVAYARSHNLAVQEHYDYVCSRMDIPVYMDYIISQLWIANTDNDNVKFFHAEGRKWHWFLYDTDLSMRLEKHNTLEQHLNPRGTGAGGYIRTTLINALLKNPEFYDAFMRRFAWHLNEIWNEENVIARIDEIATAIEYDMKKDTKRFGFSYDAWVRRVGYLRDFARNRSRYLVRFIADYFDLTKDQMREYGFQV